MLKRSTKRALASLSTVTVIVGGVQFAPNPLGIETTVGPATASAAAGDYVTNSFIRSDALNLILTSTRWDDRNSSDNSPSGAVFDVQLALPSGSKTVPDNPEFTWSQGNESGPTRSTRLANNRYRVEVLDTSGNPRNITIENGSPLQFTSRELTSQEQDDMNIGSGAAGPWSATPAEKEAEPDPALNADPDTCIVRDEIRGATVYVSRTEGSETVLERRLRRVS